MSHGVTFACSTWRRPRSTVVFRLVCSIRALGAKGMRPLRVGASPVPHAEILNHVRGQLAGQGIDLRIDIFETFDEPNDLVVSGHLDANFFQYLPFLREFNRRTRAGLVPIAPVHIEPFGLYSSYLTDIAALPRNAEVVLPGDPVNVGRALRILESLGLIECSDSAAPTVSDIRSNPGGLVFKELTSWLLVDVLDDFDAVFLFGNQAMGRGLHSAQCLHRVHGDSTYAEYLVTRAELRDDVAITALAGALNSADTRQFLAATYGDQLIAAF